MQDLQGALALVRRKKGGQSPASTKIKSKAGVPHSAPMALRTIEECGARAESRDTYPAKGRLFRCDVAVRNGR